MGGELPLPLAEIVTHVVSSYDGIIYNGSTHEPPATRNDPCAGAIDNPNNAVEKQPPSFSQPVTHVPSSDGYIMIGSTPDSSTVPTDPCTVAMETLKKCEYDHWHRQNDLVNHLDTYRVQFDQYCKVNPTSRPEWLEDAFGQEFNKRTRRVTMLVNEAEERLRSARLDAKNAGAADPNSPDQTSDFLSTPDDGLKPKITKLLIDSCNHERILEWQKATVKAKKMQLSEFNFATSGAEMNTWDSLSATGDSSKRRKIDETSRWVRSDPGPVSDESCRPQPRGRRVRSTRRRTRSEIAFGRVPLSLSSDNLPTDSNDHQFSFTYPVVDDTVWMKKEDWNDMIILDD